MAKATSEEEFLQKVINDITSIVENWLRDSDAGPYGAQILMTILLSNKPLRQREIAQKLNISVSTVSRNIKFITNSPPLITRTRVPNSKEWQYERRSTTPYVLLTGIILSFIEFLRGNILPMEQVLNQIKAFHSEVKALKSKLMNESQLNRFEKLLENLVFASKILLEELEQVLVNFQTRITS